MTRTPPLTRRLVALACAAGALAAAAPASADSLVFVKNSNVWLANPDGSGQYQVTTDGTAANPYTSPSQADDGTIVAARARPAGGPLYRMRQNGQLVNTIPVAPMLAGPFAPHVSPDGRLVAYEHVFSRSVNGYIETSSDVRFTRADGSTPQGIGPETGRGAGAPSWIDSTRAFVGVNAIATTQVVGQSAVQWWSDYDHQPQWFSFGESVEDGEVAPNGRIAVVRGDHEDNTIQLYDNTGGFTSLPTPTCTLSGPSPGPLGKRFVDPTFSPAGDAVAWQEGNGIWTMDIPAAGCATGTPRLLIAGASDPDWGPAAVNPGPRPRPKPVPGSTGTPGSAPTLAASVAPVKLRGALRKGVRLRVRTPSGGRVSARAASRGRVVARGSRAVERAGAATVSLRFTTRARRTLRRRRAVKLAVTLRFTPTSGAAVRERLAVTLAR
ncbi:MAG TPA: hypothetical protein VFM58_17110 [Solirubrobacteraceae bacterium]|nr:hypothetical protein [Solirubrobacteraceae bacterium]